MKHIYFSYLLIFWAPFASAYDLSGNWACVMRSDQDPEGFSVESSIEINLVSGTYERIGDMKFEVKELGGFIVHKKTYEKGSVRVEDNIFHISPTAAHSEVIESGPLPKSAFDDSESDLLKDGSSHIVSISDDSYVLKHKNGIIDSCVRKK